MRTSIYTLERGSMRRMLNLLPADVVERAEIPGCYSLGIVDEEAEEKKLLGMIQFYVNITDESTCYAEVTYIYVLEAYRKRGLGTRLIEGMNRILRGSGIKASTLLVPIGDDDYFVYDLLEQELEAFFEKNGYVPAKRRISVWCARLEEVQEELGGIRMPENVVSIGTISETELRGMIGRIADAAPEDSPMPGDLLANLSGCDPYFSVASRRSDGEGVLLFRRLGDTLMELVLLRATGENRDHVLRELVIASMVLAGGSLSDDCLLVMREGAAARSRMSAGLVPGTTEVKMKRYVRLSAR